MADVKHTPDYPHIRKIGRYLFYFPCGISFGLVSSISLIGLGIPEDFAKDLAIPLGFLTFLALRDIEKNAEARAAIALAKGEKADG